MDFVVRMMLRDGVLCIPCPSCRPERLNLLARHHAIDRARSLDCRERHEHAAMSLTLDDPDSACSPEALVALEECMRVLGSALECLPPERRAHVARVLLAGADRQSPPREQPSTSQSERRMQRRDVARVRRRLLASGVAAEDLLSLPLRGALALIGLDATEGLAGLL